MAALLKHYISFDTDPLQLLLALVDLLLDPGLQDSRFAGRRMDALLLGQYGGKHTQTDQHPCACIAALSVASVPTWYKALFETVLRIWEDDAQQLCSMAVSGAACKAQISVARMCAQAFAALIQVTKHHRDKQVSAA